MIPETLCTENRSGDLRARAAKAAAWALLDRWASRTVSTVVIIVLGRLLSPSEFGLVALALVVRHFVNVFIDQGFCEAIIQAPQMKGSFLNTAFWTAVGTGVGLTLITVIAAPFVAQDILGTPSVAPLLRVLAISLVLSALSSTQSALLQRNLAFRDLAIRRVTADVVAGIVAVVAAFMGAGAWSIVLQTLVQTAVGAAILWRYSKWRPQLEFDSTAFRSLFGFGLSMIGIDVLNVVQQQADNFLVGRSLGIAALGIYALAFRFYFVVVDITMSSISAVALPTFARVQHDLLATKNAFLAAARVMALMALPIFAGMGVVAPEMVSVLVGDKWSSSALVLRALCPSGLILCLAYLEKSLVVAIGRPRVALAVNAVGVALRLVGYIVGVQFGVVGVAVGLSVTSILYWPFRVLILRSLAGVSLRGYARQLRSAAVSAIAMVFALVLLRSTVAADVAEVALLSLEVFVGLVVYTITLAFLDRTALNELVDIARLALGTGRSRHRRRSNAEKARDETQV